MLPLPLSHPAGQPLGSSLTAPSLGFPICEMGDRSYFAGSPRRVKNMEVRVWETRAGRGGESEECQPFRAFERPQRAQELLALWFFIDKWMLTFHTFLTL